MPSIGAVKIAAAAVDDGRTHDRQDAHLSKLIDCTVQVLGALCKVPELCLIRESKMKLLNQLCFVHAFRSLLKVLKSLY